MANKLIIQSQRDPRWKDHKIGNSSITLGAYGCTTTALSSLTSYFGCYKDPVEIQQFQDYTADGLILWDTLRLPPMKFVKRLYGQQDKEIQDAINDPNKGCLIEVKLKSGGSHWLLAIGKVPLSTVYNVIDPWNGDKCTTMRYNNKIIGAAIYSNKI